MSVAAMLDAIASRLEGGRAGSRFPLLQLLRREGPVSAPECGALVFEVARLRALLAALPVERSAGDAGPTQVRTLGEAYASALDRIEHVARLGAASGDGARLESEAAPAPSVAAVALR